VISTKEERMFGRRTNKNASSKLSSSTSKGGSSRGGEAATRSRIAKKVLPGKNLKKKQQGKSLNSSSNAAPPRRGFRLHDEQGNMIDDEPVQSFISNLSTISAPDEWRERMECLRELVESIPSADILPNVGGVTPWYRSPPTLRRLHVPLSALLADARSVVAKQVTKNVAELVESCSRVASCEGSNSVGDPCRYLLKDLLPAVIALHGQTVSIIKGYAKAMMERIIIACRFKSGLPVLLEKLRKEKSKDVREACVNYISLVITHWSGTQTGGKKNYLTLDICNHLGNGLARAMSDPAQVVRKEARIAFEVYRQKYPKLWSEIVHRPDGPVSKDARLKKGILAAAEKAGQVNVTNIRQQSQQHQQLKPRTSSRNPNPYHQDAQCRGGNMDEDESVSVHSQGSQSMSSKLSFSSRTSNNSNITGMSGRSYSSLYSKNVFNTAQDTDSASVGSSSSHRSSNIQPPSPSFRNRYNSSLLHNKSHVTSLGLDTNSDDSEADVHDPVEEAIRERASTSIQAAFRGSFTRSLVLSDLSLSLGNGTNEVERTPPYKQTKSIHLVSSKKKRDRTNEFSRNKRESLLGTTAAHMIERRQTLLPGEVPPPAESPGGMSFMSMHSTPQKSVSDVRTPLTKTKLGHTSQISTSRLSSHGKQNLKETSGMKQQYKSTSSNGPNEAHIDTELESIGVSNEIARNKRRNGSMRSSMRLQGHMNSFKVVEVSADTGNNNQEYVATTRTLPIAQMKASPQSSRNSVIVEHKKIASQVLAAHKEYVDKVMENLREEMEAIQVFEELLMAGGTPRKSAVIRPSEEEVLGYFEEVHKFVDRAAENGSKLTENLDKVSHGDEVYRLA